MKQKNSLSKKLIRSYVILSFLIILIFNFFIYFMVTEYTYKMHFKSANEEVTQIDSGVIKYIEKIQQDVSMIADSDLIKGLDVGLTSYVNKKGVNGIIPMTPLNNGNYEEAVYKSFEHFLMHHKDIRSAFIGAEKNGGYVQWPAKPRKEGYDPRKRSWYKLAMENPEKVNVDKACRTSSGDVSINIPTIIKDKFKKTRGVFSVDISLEHLTDIISKSKIGELGFVIVVDEDGMILANPKNQRSVLKNIKQLKVKGLENVKQLEGVEKKITFIDGKRYSIKAKKCESKHIGWYYITFISNDEVLSSARKIGLANSIIGIILMIICMFVASILGRKVSKPIIYLSKNINLIGTGDFSIKVDRKNLKMDDEIGEIARSTERMKNKVRNMLGDVKVGFNNVEAGTENLNKASKQMAQASTEVANTIQQVAKSIISQADELSNINFLTRESKMQLGNMSEYLKDVSTKSKCIDAFASNSNEDMRELEETIKNIKFIFQDFSKKVGKLDNEINKIKEITNLIDKIAEQTNLLALNAAIEAARVGEEGLGFAVVAGEVRNLSEQTKESANNIKNRIKNIIRETDDILDTSNELNTELDNQGMVVGNSMRSFKTIITSIEEIVPMIDNLYDNVKEINSKNNEIVINIQSVSSAAEEVSASTEEISASAEEMSATADQVSETAESLRNSTTEVMEKVNVFKLN